MVGVVLHSLLYLHLYAALVLTDIKCHLAQAAAYELGHQYGQRGHYEQGPGQPSVKIVQQQERAYKLDAGDAHLGQGIGGGF